MTAPTATPSEIDSLKALLADAAVGLERLGVHAPGCHTYDWEPDAPPCPCDCGLDPLTRACERASLPKD